MMHWSEVILEKYRKACVALDNYNGKFIKRIRDLRILRDSIDYHEGRYRLNLVTSKMDNPAAVFKDDWIRILQMKWRFAAEVLNFERSSIK